MKSSLGLATCALIALVSGQLRAQKPEPPMLGVYPHVGAKRMTATTATRAVIRPTSSTTMAAF